jgi:hypothetical protein
MAEYTYSEPVAGVYSEPWYEVRYLLNDTVPAAPFSLSDAEIQYELVAVAGVVRFAAANVAMKMSGRYSSQAVKSKHVGNTSISRDYTHVSGYYRMLATNIRSNKDRGYMPAVYYTGGVTAADAQFTVTADDNGGQAMPRQTQTPVT